MLDKNQANWGKRESTKQNLRGLGFESLDELFRNDEGISLYDPSVIEDVSYLELEGKKLEKDALVKVGEVIQFLASFTLFFLFLPIGILIALIMKISSPSEPIFFTQKRVGKGGKEFDVIKFRTMIVGAENKTGAVLSWNGDPRITPLGSFLRKSHLDEIPQLINVLKSEMNLIGPRPERPEFTNSYNKSVYGYKYRELVKPGITGLAQIAAEYDAIAEKKIVYDLYYIRHRNSLGLLLTIALSTALKMLAYRSHAKIVKKAMRVSYV
ncbi:MAG: sugar transferase [Bacteriovoracaceae bacterium]|jgi:lipopolysaccharide/colanic/teichoic acid biosynthesis glycosyltransferase|nr:sugar transferase [Bacteriovoracaceae bacterium]